MTGAASCGKTPAAVGHKHMDEFICELHYIEHQPECLCFHRVWFLPWLAYRSVSPALEWWRWRGCHSVGKDVQLGYTVDISTPLVRIKIWTVPYVAEFGLLLACAAAASLQRSPLLQTEVLLLGHPGAPPPLLQTQLLLRAACPPC